MSQEQKTPISRTLPLMVDDAIRKAIDKQGRALPCKVEAVNGAIVTVSFQLSDAQLPQVQLPLAGAEYIRYPIQVGCLGACFPVDTYMGQITGLGTGTASLGRRGNLSTLVFFPCGNANWSSVDPNAVTIYGPNGVVLRDSDSKSVITLTPANIDLNAQTNLTLEAGSEILLTVGSNSILLNATEAVITIGAATLTMTAAGIVSSVPITAPTVTGSTSLSAGTSLKVAGKEMSGHEHNVVGVTTGGSTVVSGPPL